MTKTNFNDVATFHALFDLPRPATPRLLDPATQLFRSDFMFEELGEFNNACRPALGREPDLAKAADALIDLVYVAMGTAVMMGLPWQALWDEVQRANLDKVRARADGSDSKRGSALDVVKPPGWVGPDIEGVLQRASAVR